VVAYRLGEDESLAMLRDAPRLTEIIRDLGEDESLSMHVDNAEASLHEALG